MTDILLQLGPDGGDFCLTDAGELATEGGLRSAIIVSLFSDARFEGVEGGPRGFWGGEPGEGSLLWLLAREKQTQDVLVRARGYAEDALAWLIEDGIASKVTVRATYPTPGRLELHVSIERGANPAWEHLWRATDAFLSASDVVSRELLSLEQPGGLGTMGVGLIVAV